MQESLQNPTILPGASSLGFGFNIVTAVSPTTFKAQIVSLDLANSTPITINTPNGPLYFSVPGNVSEVDRNIYSLTFNTFTSQSDYDTYMSAKASVEASGWGYSASFDATYSSLTEGDTTNFYGLVEADTILWDTQLNSFTGDMITSEFLTALMQLPATFNGTAAQQQAYFSFFDIWGTHIVNQSRVGGSLNYLVTTTDESQLTTQAAHANMTLEYNALFVDASASASADWNSMNSSWFSARKTYLTYVGGSSEVLKAVVLPTLPTWQPDYSSSALVKAWADTLTQNPSVVSVSLIPIYSLAAGLGTTPQEKAMYRNFSNQLETALAVYLLAPIAVFVTVPFAIAQSNNWPYISGQTAPTVLIGENSIPIPNQPRLTDVSLYWIVMADENCNVAYNANLNSENPDDLDSLILAAQKASEGQQWWVCICIVNQAEAPLSTLALAWFNELGINTAELSPNYTYPGMSIVITAVGKTNSNYPKGQVSHLQPYEVLWGYGPQAQDITISSAIPAYVGTIV